MIGRVVGDLVSQQSFLVAKGSAKAWTNNTSKHNEDNNMNTKTIPIQNASSVLLKVEAAINAHNIDAFVNCFAPDFEGEHPVHPERNLIGAEQVRKNWTALFAQVPDLQAKLITHTIAGELGWSEWHWQGNLPTAQNSICEALWWWDWEKTRSHGRGCI